MPRPRSARAISSARMRRSITAARVRATHDRGEHQRVADRGEQQRPQHADIHGRRAGEADRRRLVQRVPPIDAELDDRQVHHADQRQDRAGAVAALRIVERAHQRDVAEIEEEQHQHRGQPRVPHPPGAPHRLAPDAAGEQAQRGEAGADRADLGRRQVGQRMAPDQRQHGAERQCEIPRRCEPGGRDMHIHDAHRVALLPVGRRERTGPRPGRPRSAQRRRRRATAAPRRTGAGSAPGWRNGAASARGFAHSDGE